MQHHHPLPHPITTPSNHNDLLLKNGKKRGNYNCGRCGLPKKGHKCPFTPSIDGAKVHDNLSHQNDETVVGDESADISTPVVNNAMDLASATSPPAKSVLARGPPTRRRALYFNDDDDYDDFDEVARLPVSCLWEILRRLPPSGLVAAGGVCRGWREALRRVWCAAEEMRLRVPTTARIGFVGFVLQNCPGLLRLTLRIESDVDATMLACIAFSCPNIQFLEILTSGSSTNWISGDALSRFINDKRCLTSLKMEGCLNLGGLSFSSTSLSTLWLSDLSSLPKMVFSCPNLKEISLDLSRQENDTTDLASIMDSLGRSCPKLQNIHIASTKLSHATVLALSVANLRELRMLSLVLGTEIIDASIAAITSSFPKLELLDLSGSSISDSGIGMICNVLPETLSKLLLALCPNVTSSGIQFAAAQLHHLELLDCGKTINDPSSEDPTNEEDDECELQKTPNSKLHLTYQKLIIKHDRLRKLSLWGCSGLDALYLNCPHLSDLNLNSCTNLHPERLLLQCPSLQTVHASDCPDMLVKTIETQVSTNPSHAAEYQYPLKRLPDASKRVCVPLFCSPQTCQDEKKLERPVKRQCVVIVNSLLKKKNESLKPLLVQLSRYVVTFTLHDEQLRLLFIIIQIRPHAHASSYLYVHLRILDFGYNI